ncbi:MAG TPA: hypothetical protein VHO46_00385 [Bacteroidales bacterium]|nr:hypothetical protein [Bacteroidales bacterium]
MKKKYFIILILFLTVPYKPAIADSPVKGYIDITVESNINKVLFSYPISSKNIISGNTDKVIVPVKDFKCNNKSALKDFVTLLKADEYPDITIELPSDAFMRLRTEDEIVLNNIPVKIAGVRREYDIICRAEVLAGGERMLAGTIIVGLSDLNINPTPKYFGMVKIKDEVFVKFGLGLNSQGYASK